MSESIAQFIIQNKPHLPLSNELIDAAVAVISNDMNESHVADEILVSAKLIRSEECPKGREGFLYRVDKITRFNIMDYLVGFGEYDVKRGMVCDFWSNHHVEIIEYCQSNDPYAGQKSAVRTVVHLMSDIENREKHYSDERIKDALFSSATEGADLTAMIIRIYAMSCVLLAVIDSYKASSKQKN